jgi:hypothetical protein
VRYIYDVSALALVVAIVTRIGKWLIAVPFFGYGSACFGHFSIQKNKPATFGAPLRRRTETTYV